MPVAVEVSLEEDGAGCVFGGISGDGERSGQIGKVEDGFREEEAFEGIEGSLT